MKNLLPRLYSILDTELSAAHGLDPLSVCDAWLAAGIRLIQLRAKSMSSGPLLGLADALVARTRAAGATLIINDRADIAVQCGADGVHVGQDDLPPGEVRRIVGPEAIVGLSTHSDAQVAEAVMQPVSYVAIGPVFGTRTKDTGYAAVGLDQVRRAAAVVHAAGLPLVAIGGLTLDRSGDVLGAGADSLAVIGDLTDVPDLATARGRAREWASL